MDFLLVLNSVNHVLLGTGMITCSSLFWEQEISDRGIADEAGVQLLGVGVEGLWSSGRAAGEVSEQHFLVFQAKAALMV